MNWLSILLLVTLFVCVHGQEPTARYSTKTDYESSFEPGTDEKDQRVRDWPTIANDVGEAAAMSGCEPIGVYVVYRHGMRYPSKRDIENYEALLARMKMTGVSDEFGALLNITENLYPIALQNEQHPAGFTEMERVAARIKHLLPELFSQDSLTGFEFQGTFQQRTIDSAHAFIDGLQGPGANCTVSSKTDTRDILSCTSNTTSDVETVAIDYKPKFNDLLLRFFDNCTNFITQVGRNDSAFVEVDRFEEGPELTSVLEAVANKLAPTGSTEPWNMTNGDLKTMHDMCGYEIGYYGSSPWCSIFTNAESLVVEYWLDLVQYWAEGYGYNINYEMACPLVDDIIEYVTSVKLNKTAVSKGKFKFAHSPTLQPFLAILGLFKDSPKLFANNYDVSVNRVWRTGRISPMAGHVSFNVFQCPSDEYRILALHNELPIKLGACEDFFCVYDDVVSHLEMSSNGCRWDALCGTDGVYPGEGRGDSLHKLSLFTLMLTIVVSSFVSL